jgi:uncharacterized protein (DUF2252 family)
VDPGAGHQAKARHLGSRTVGVDIERHDDVKKTTADRIQHLSPEERAARGRAARSKTPRSGHAQWSQADRQHGPLELLAAQAATRVPDLVPIRHGRMAASPFAYYRGAASPMAADLSSLPRTGLDVQLCGDAHLSNFGGFASPERALVFDINDFDETNPGPFEWDVKRLAASLEVAARSKDFATRLRREIVAKSVRSYRESIQVLATQRHLDVWYSRLDAAGIVARWGGTAQGDIVAKFQRAVGKAQTKDRLKAQAKLTHEVDGEPRIISDPPLIVPVEELLSDIDARQVENTIHEALRSYRRSLPGDRRRLLERYRFVHLAQKVVGVGSVGTREWVALLLGRDENDPLFLQVKEAEASVLERFLGKSGYTNHGQRVVEGQRLMQAASDILLGWTQATEGDGLKRDYYIRQLWDWKASADVDSISPDVLAIYGQMCGWTLARAHACSGDAIAIGSYLGETESFDRAITEFAGAYADQTDKDHRAFVDAIAAGAIKARSGL